MLGKDDGPLMANVTGNDSEAYCEGALQNEDIGYVGPNLTRNPENSGAIIE